MKTYQLKVHFEITRDHYIYGQACLIKNPETKIRGKHYTPVGKLRAYMRDILQDGGMVGLPEKSDWRDWFTNDQIAMAEIFVHNMLNPESRVIKV